jgi:WD40 repeat protein
MLGIRGLERLAILAAIVLVAACGSSGAASQTPSSAATAQLTSTGPATSTASSTPPATPAQASPGQSLPPGVTVVDTASSIQRLDWSPDGKLLAVLTWGGTFGTGRVDVLDLTGHQITSLVAVDMAWVDDTHLMTLGVSPDDTTHGTVTIFSIDGTVSGVVPGTFGGMLGNGHGSVALTAPVAVDEVPAKESFQVWSNGQLGPRTAGYGLPIRWSADGRLLALIGATSTSGSGANRTPAHGVVLTAAGSSLPGTLTVLSLPEKTVVLSRPLPDIRLDVYFSPNGSRLATSDGLVLTLASGRGTQLTGNADGWAPGGALVLVGQDHRVSLWTPTGTTVIPDAFEWAALGPDEGDIATLPAADENVAAPVTAVVRRAGGEVSIPLSVGLSIATWSAGGVCFVATGTIDAQREDNRLLRIELPAR